MSAWQLAAASAALMLGVFPTAAAEAADGAPDGVPPSPRRTHWAVVYKADVLESATPRAFAALDNLNLQADVDAALLFGWEATALHAELLSNHGSKLNRKVGTAQGISNIEVTASSVRLYATWAEHQFKATRSRLLIGLYDLNSEFYATDASGMLIHPSFGIGIDFSQSGRNGPSIFPNLGLGARLRQPIGNAGYVQLAVVDGVPGDPAHPGRTTVHLGRSDGALLVGETGWQGSSDAGPRPTHWGVGAWQYTQRTGLGNAPDAAATARNQGAYALAQTRLAGSRADPTTGFIRAGFANRRLNAIDLAVDGGVYIARPMGPQGPLAATAGFAIAHFSRAVDASTQKPLRREATFEVDARWQTTARLALQPVLQWVQHPGGRSGSTAVAGARLEWVLEPKR